MNDIGPWPWKVPVALYPEQKSQRQHVQRGWFTIHGENNRPLEVQQTHWLNGGRRRSKFLTYVDVEQGERKDLENMVRQAGWNKYTIYQDLDSLAKVVSEQTIVSMKARYSASVKRSIEAQT